MLRVARVAHWAGDDITPKAVHLVVLGAEGALGRRPGELAQVQAATAWLAYVQGAHLTLASAVAPRVYA